MGEKKLCSEQQSIKKQGREEGSHLLNLLFFFRELLIKLTKTWTIMNRNEYFCSPLSSQIRYHVEHQKTQECSLRNWSRNEVKPQTGLSGQVGLPDHSLKQVLNNQMWLSHHNQQGHMGPSKLKWQAQTNTHTMATHIQTHTHKLRVNGWYVVYSLKQWWYTV